MANYKFKTTNIRGKQYVEVNERIKFFRQETKYDGWGIHTDINMLDGDQCLCKCTIVDAAGQVMAQGHAHEVKSSSNINKTSHVENCETSAVGRALAMLGIGIDTSIASANEVTELSPSNKRWSTILMYRSWRKSSTPLSKTSWTRRSPTSKVRQTSVKLSTPSRRSMEVS